MSEPIGAVPADAKDFQVPPAGGNQLSVAESNPPAIGEQPEAAGTIAGIPELQLDPASPPEPVTESEITIDEKRVQASERIIEVGKSLINRQIELLTEKAPKDRKQREAWLAEQNNIGPNRIDAIDFLMHLPADLHGNKELRFSDSDSPIKVLHNGQEVTLKNIEGINGQTDEFVCQAINQDGKPLAEAIKVSREIVVAAQILADKEIIRETLPEGQQREMFDKYTEILSARLQGKDSLADADETTLEALDKLATDTEAVLKPEEIEERDPTMDLTGQNIKHAMIELEKAVKDDKKGKKQLEKEQKEAIHKIATELGKKPTELTEQEITEAMRIVVKDRMNRQIDTSFLSNEEKGVYETRIQTFRVINERPPTDVELLEIRREVIFQRVTESAKRRFNDEKYIKELEHELGWKDLLGYLALLGVQLATEFSQDVAQTK